MQSKRLNSRWKYIFINDDSKNNVSYYALNELGKIVKALSQPKRIFNMKKYDSINKVIKELVKNPQLYSKKIKLSFSGNIEVFSKENNYEKYFAMANSNDNQIEKEKEDFNVEKDGIETNNEKEDCDFFKFFDFNVEEMQSDTEFDDYFKL